MCYFNLNDSLRKTNLDHRQHIHSTHTHRYAHFPNTPTTLSLYPSMEIQHSEYSYLAKEQSKKKKKKCQQIRSILCRYISLGKYMPVIEFKVWVLYVIKCLFGFFLLVKETWTQGYLPPNGMKSSQQIIKWNIPSSFKTPVLLSPHLLLLLIFNFFTFKK